jgi:hypothetical protein
MKLGYTKWVDVYNATLELDIIHKDAGTIKKGTTEAVVETGPNPAGRGRPVRKIY